MYFSKCLFFEEKLKLPPIVISPTLILSVLEGMHWNLARFIPRYNLSNKKSIAHIFTIVLD